VKERKIKNRMVFFHVVSLQNENIFQNLKCRETKLYSFTSTFFLSFPLALSVCPSPIHSFPLPFFLPGWNDVSWHNDQVVSPNMQQLVDTGVQLEQSYVQPLCTPSRSAFLTGLYPFRLGRQVNLA